MKRCLAALAGLWALAGPAEAKVFTVSNVNDLQTDLGQAQSGDTITVLPGTYVLPGALLLGGQNGNIGLGTLQGTGKPEATVLVGRANQAALEVSGPNWTIQQLSITSALTGIQVDDGGSGLKLSRLRIHDTADGVALGPIGDLVCALSGVQLSNLVLFQMTGDALTLNSACSASIYYLTTWSVREALLVQGISNQPTLTNNLWATKVAKPGQGDRQLPSATDTSWFVDPVNARDFHLAPGMPPVGAGVSTGITVDADGDLRPLTAPDVGAYQGQATGDGGTTDAAGDASTSGNPGAPVGHLGGGQEAPKGLGCACETVRGSRSDGSPLPRLVALGGLLFMLARRRRRAP